MTNYLKLTFFEGLTRKKRVKKLMEKKNRWSCTNEFQKKPLTGATFLLASAANHDWYKLFFLLVA